MTAPRFHLNEVERMSPLWQRLHTHLVNRLADKRKQNDHMRTPEDTARLRGEIAALKYLTEDIIRSPTEFAASEN